MKFLHVNQYGILFQELKDYSLTVEGRDSFFLSFSLSSSQANSSVLKQTFQTRFLTEWIEQNVGTKKLSLLVVVVVCVSRDTQFQSKS